VAGPQKQNQPFFLWDASAWKLNAKTKKPQSRKGKRQERIPDQRSPFGDLDWQCRFLLRSAIPKNSAFLAKFFLLFVSFVSFCKMLLVAALPGCAFAPLR
jgi:hypothetical protein